jgi:tRNA pseudouridine38-40 synthase
MLHRKVILTYDGTPFNGWQIQPGLPTVQGTLADAIQHVTGETVLPQGSGRTDTGVHALGQVATFSLDSPIPTPNLHRALNRILPASIRILAVEEMPHDFHARHSALRKTYEYRILPNNQFCSPMRAPYLWDCRWNLDLDTLQQSATHVLGTHDFTSFAATDRDLTTRSTSEEDDDPTAVITIPPTNVISTEAVDKVHSAAERPLFFGNAGTPSSHTPQSKTIPVGNIRTIHQSAWSQQEDLLIYTVTGSGFLHHMVRNLVGTFVLAGSGRISSNDVLDILNARNRSAAGPTAPARGLFLIEVEY